MLLQSKSHQTASAAMRVRLEKQEIDKLLKKVRERKRVGLARDPNIRLDDLNRPSWPRKWSVHQTPNQKRFADNELFIMQNPIVVTGIRRKYGDHFGTPGKGPGHQWNQPLERMDQAPYVRDAPLSQTLDAADGQQIKI